VRKREKNVTAVTPEKKQASLADRVEKKETAGRVGNCRLVLWALVKRQRLLHTPGSRSKEKEKKGASHASSPTT